MYCLNMLAIALELATENSAYEDVASKFFEHFVYIAQAMNDIGDEGIELVGCRGRLLTTTSCISRTASSCPSKIRSMVGLIPLFAVETLDPKSSTSCRASSGACSGSSKTARSLERAYRNASH